VRFELGEGLGQQLLEALQLELHDLDLRYIRRDSSSEMSFVKRVV
jgi:hypothetical protein